ncbi:MAG: transporter substrate-binding domain-containing protein [Velocimicrobium sp.]
MKKLISMMLVVCLVFSLTACGSKTVAKEETTTNSSKSEKPILRVGMEGDYAPFDWLQSDDSNGAVLTDNGTYMNGYDIMIAQKIADELGYELEVHQVAWDGLIASVQTDKIDCVIAGMSITAERALSVDFSDAYYVADLVGLTRSDGIYASATSLDDLAGCTISANINTIWYDALDQIKDSTTVEAALDTTTSAITAVSSGKVDCIVMDTPSAMSVLMSHPELTMLPFDDGKGFNVSDEDKLIGIAIKKGNSELLDHINQVLAGIPDTEREELLQSALTKQPLNSEE